MLAINGNGMSETTAVVSVVTETALVLAAAIEAFVNRNANF